MLRTSVLYQIDCMYRWDPTPRTQGIKMPILLGLTQKPSIRPQRHSGCNPRLAVNAERRFYVCNLVNTLHQVESLK